MLLLVSKFKMIGMLLNVVRGQVQKTDKKHKTKESKGFHDSTLITMLCDNARIRIQKLARGPSSRMTIFGLRELRSLLMDHPTVEQPR